eukprot:2155401-Rhodomonas_salina.1
MARPVLQYPVRIITQYSVACRYGAMGRVVLIFVLLGRCGSSRGSTTGAAVLRARLLPVRIYGCAPFND